MPSDSQVRDSCDLQAPCTCGGECSGYGSRSVCPSLLVLATLVQAKDELMAALAEAGFPQIASVLA